VDELVFFSSSPQTREAMQALVAKLREIGSKAATQAQREITEADADKIIDGALASLKERRGSSPAKLDLTPVPTASDSL
jgi:menaquinone-dependent protoporphyrinogen IX oxidase